MLHIVNVSQVIHLLRSSETAGDCINASLQNPFNDFSTLVCKEQHEIATAINLNKLDNEVFEGGLNKRMQKLVGL